MIAQPSSTHEKSDTFETDLHKMYPTVWLMQLAKKTKFIKRERKIKPDRLSQNSTHFYNWIMGIVDFKSILDNISHMRHKLTL